MNIQEAKSFIGMPLRLTWTGRRGDEQSDLVYVFNVGFVPLYGPHSADRFQHAARDLGLEAVAVSIPNLADDVDTREDLDRLQLRAGGHTQAALAGLRLAS